MVTLKRCWLFITMLLVFLATSFASAQVPIDPKSEAFEAAQWAVTTEAASALAKVAARFASGSGELAVLEHERDGLLARRDAAEHALVAILMSPKRDGPTDAGLADANVPALRANLAQIAADIARTERAIEKVDPAYFELTRPQALTVAQTQSLLNEDEGLLFILVNDDASYSFAITREAISWSRNPGLGEAALSTMTRRLRVSAQDDVYWEPASFDRKTAFQLYQGLVAPVEATFKGKSLLITVTTGPLAALPLTMLATSFSEEAGAATSLQTAPFLIDRYAITTLPAVSSLRALRCLLVSAAERHAGCDTTLAARAGPAVRNTVAFAGIGAPLLEGRAANAERGSSRSAPSGAVAFSNGLADPSALRKLVYLAGSKQELTALGDQFSSSRVLMLGADAREDLIRASKDLANARYIVFSTHGLLAGQTGDAGEPGLVFTPPAQASPGNDGLLTASEAAQLHLSADLVVLSACNTAASDGRPAAEGLSGLARAFLYAGARSMLVSHWEVSDVATPTLMTELFRHMQTGDQRQSAYALQAAIKKVRANAAWASPGFWAPFALVGTGR